MQHNRSMHVCLGFNSNHIYKSTPGVRCGLLVQIYSKGIKRLPVSTSQVTDFTTAKEERERSKEVM